MKTWSITGASRGFGLLIAKLALERGDNVVATARKPEAVLNVLGAQEKLLALPLNVTNEQDAVSAAEQAVVRFGRIDVLVNNAGYGPLDRTYTTIVVEPRWRPCFRRRAIADYCIG
jgi:NAD(P)-dependent dehydrogenase (short-subunit alcohol dehydrogenase family)